MPGWMQTQAFGFTPNFPHFLAAKPLDLCQRRGRLLKIYVRTGLARHFLVCCIKPVTRLNVSWTSASDKRLPPPPGTGRGPVDCPCEAAAKRLYTTRID